MGTRKSTALMWLFCLLCWLWLSAESSVGAAQEGDIPHDLAFLLEGLSTDRIVAHIARLSAPELNGRQTGTLADLHSALYVKEQLFRPPDGRGQGASGAQGLLPELRSAQVTVRQIDELPSLELVLGQESTSLTVGTGYLPLMDSPPADLIGHIVFVGYGISDPARAYDEYADLNVRNRVVLFLRGKPTAYPVRVSHAEKVRLAMEKGAVAFLMATGPIRNPYELRRGIPAGPVAYYGQPGTADEYGLPGAWIHTDVADLILSSAGLSLESVQTDLNRARAPRSQELNVSARLVWKSQSHLGSLNNVVSLVPAQGSAKADETVVLGAHRDHFGRQAGLLFPGADDNASGTAVMLEISRAIARALSPLQRTLVFVSFSGEEQGLLGSRLYVERAERPLRRTVAMINLDHVGVGNGRLTVGVAGMSKDLAERAARLTGLQHSVDIYGYFPGGDHVPFREAGVPTITVVSGGSHPHFHQPTDHVHTIQPHVLSAVTRYVLTLVWLLAFT